MLRYVMSCNVTLHYITLHYIMLYYVILYHIMLYYSVLCCILLYSIILYHIILYCIILYYTILHYITLYYVILETTGVVDEAFADARQSMQYRKFIDFFCESVEKVSSKRLVEEPRIATKST